MGGFSGVERNIRSYSSNFSGRSQLAGEGLSTIQRRIELFDGMLFSVGKEVRILVVSQHN
jgi:hypothetical protein